jgi:hypothetical protein
MIFRQLDFLAPLERRQHFGFLGHAVSGHPFKPEG